MCLGENQRMVEIGHLTLELSSFVLEIFQWWLYNTLSIPSNWLFNTQSRVLQAYWLMLENNEKATLNINMPNQPYMNYIVFPIFDRLVTTKVSKYSFKPVSTSHQCRELIYVYVACSYLHCCPDYSHAWATAIVLSNYSTLKHKNRVEDEVISRQFLIIFNKQSFES